MNSKTAFFTLAMTAIFVVMFNMGSAQAQDDRVNMNDPKIIQDNARLARDAKEMEATAIAKDIECPTCFKSADGTLNTDTTPVIAPPDTAVTPAAKEKTKH